MPKVGRKFQLSIIALIILLGGFGLAALSESLESVYPELIGGVLGVLAIYCGGNVSNKFVASRRDKTIQNTENIPS